jgi:hypothetical protein
MINEGGREDGTCGSYRGQGCSLVIFLFAAVLEKHISVSTLSSQVNRQCLDELAMCCFPFK